MAVPVCQLAQTLVLLSFFSFLFPNGTDAREFHNYLEPETRFPQARCSQTPFFQRHSRSLQGMDNPSPSKPSPSRSSFDGFLSFSASIDGDFSVGPAKDVGGPQVTPITGSLRRAAFAADVDEIADILTTKADILKLSAGLMFDPPDRPVAVRKTTDRNQDPDVAVLKGVAKSLLDTGLSLKLARIMSLSLSRGAVLTLLSTITLNQRLLDRDLMASILAADANIEFVPSTGRRRLACDGCSPASSFVCANCWPSTVCVDMFWCSG